MRILVVTNISPDPDNPQRGSFVRDQVEALRGADLQVELFSFPPGKRNYVPATRRLRNLLRRERFDVVHAHYGLAGWCAALAGARPLVVTFHGTDVRHRLVGPLSRRLVRRIDLAAAVSSSLFGAESGRPGLAWRPGASAVLPCGPDLNRFRPRPRREARQALGLPEDEAFLLFPAAPARRLKRHDRAVEVAKLAEAPLRVASEIDPASMPDWINAASAVLVPSEREGFGLVAAEALACDVPVLSTPVGVAPLLLRDIEGCLVAPYDRDDWSALARVHLDTSDPRVDGRARAEWFASEPMAERVLLAYGAVLDRGSD